MNIMLSALQSNPVDIRDIPLETAVVPEEFSDLINQQLSTVAAEIGQLTDLKEYYPDNLPAIADRNLPTETASVGVWNGFAHAQTVTLNANKDNPALQHQPIQRLQGADNKLPENPLSAITSGGESLPVAGKILPSDADFAAPRHRFNLQQPVSLDDSKPIGIEENILSTQPRPMSAQVGSIAAPEQMPISAQVGSIATPEQMPISTLAERAAKIAVILPDDVSRNIQQIDPAKIAAVVPLPLPLSATRMNSVPATEAEGKLQSVSGAALKVTLPLSEIPVIGVNDVDKVDLSQLANRPRPDGNALPLASLAGSTGESLASDPATAVPLSRDTAPMLMQPSNIPLLNTVSSPQPVIASVDVQATTATQPSLPVQLQTMSAVGSRDSVDWGNGIGERVSWMIDQKSNSATIRLDPPSLGKLDVQIKMTDEVTTITIQTQTAQTRDLIESASQRLRDYLQENGQQTVNVDVSHRQDQQQAKTEEGDKNTQDVRDEVNQENASEQPQIDYANAIVGQGLLDTFA